MGVREFVKRILTEKENRSYERRLRKLKITYGEWAEALEAKQADALCRAEAMERAEPMDKAEAAGRDFIVICSSKGSLASNAIKNITCYFNAHPKAKLLYGDEDVWPGRSQGAGKSEERRSPWFKPDWSPDLLDSCLYFGSLMAVDSELFDRVKERCGAHLSRNGKKAFCKGEMEGVDYQVMDREAYEWWLYCCVLLAEGYLKGSVAVGHVPAILFHCEDENEQMKFLDATAWFKEGRERLAQEFEKNRAAGETSGEKRTDDEAVNPVVSIVIPSKDQPEILEKCLQGCLLAAHTSPAESLPLEILLVDNGSSQENRARVEETVSRLSTPFFHVRYLYQPMEFHFSRMCNLGAEQAEGQFLLFLNDDVELCQPGCIKKMAAMAERPFTGAVGMKLLYPDSDRIQHAGITNLPMGPVHKLQFLNDSECYYYSANKVNRNMLAVTGACLMVEKDKFWEAGGFSEDLRVAFNDVDLCFRLYELGYWNVCINETHAFHHESLSRGADESAEKLGRLLGERDRLYERHPKLQGVDPFYSDYLNREGLDTRIRPAYVTAGNKAQQVSQVSGRFDPAGCRQDDCLMVRIEDSRDGRISGYSVVLGDNNACYEFNLLFCGQEKKTVSQMDKRPVTQAKAERQGGNNAGNIYAVPLEGQYRPDLEENMPDQVHVGLSGFAAELAKGALMPGNYRLGMAARNRVTGLWLINWSNRFFCVKE